MPPVRNDHRFVAILTVLAALNTIPCRAETTSTATSAQPKRWFSFAPRPLRECRYFLITEFGVVYRVDHPPKAEASVWTTVLAELGVMRNVTPLSAVGAAFYGEGGGDGSRVGIRGRYRLWLKPHGTGPSRSSLEFSPGILLWGSREYANPPLSGPGDPDLPKTRILNARYPGYAASVALNWREWLGLVFLAEYMPLNQVGPPPLSESAPRRTHDTAWYFGFRTGSYSGPIAWAAVVVSFAVFASVMDGSGAW